MRKGRPERTQKESSDKGRVSQVRDSVSVGGMTSMVYMSKTNQRLKKEGGDIRVEFGLESEVKLAIFKEESIGKSKRSYLSQRSLEDRRQA